MPGADRIKPGGRLVEIKNFRIKSQSPGQSGPLFHAAADFGRIEIVKAAQADQSQFQINQFLYQAGRVIGILLQRQRDIFTQRH